MGASPTAAEAMLNGGMMIGGSDTLVRQPVFRTRDLEEGRTHMCGVLGEHGIAYLSRESSFDLCHRQAKVGSIAVNSLQYGAGVMINAPRLPGFYLLQFTLAGECQMWQRTRHSVLPAGSIGIVNPGQGFKKAWLPGTHQLLLRIDARLVDREFRAWSGSDEAGGIEFDTPPVDDSAKIGTLLRYMRVLCDDLRSERSSLSHPLVADRAASALVSMLLVSMPHNKMRSIETGADQAIAPFFVRRVEQFIEEHAREEIALADLASVAGVSTRALQIGYRRFRSTTPMAYLRAIRLELARIDLANAARRGTSVAAVATAHGFSHLGRFARAYQARFGELPSETLYRGSIGRAS